MARISAKVKGYQSIPKAKGARGTEMSIFDTIQMVQNTLFEIRCATKKTWGYTWYDNARYGLYESARKELYTKPDCMARQVALQCVDDLQYLRNELKNFRKEA